MPATIIPICDPLMHSDKVYSNSQHSDNKPSEIYRRRAATYQERARNLEGLCKKLGHLRMISFVVALASAYGENYKAVPFLKGVAVSSFAIFLVAVSFHARRKRELREVTARARINEISLAKLERRWDEIPEHQPYRSKSTKEVDLNLIGHASLLQLLARPGSKNGTILLTKWLSEEPDKGEIRERQYAVQELAPHLELREDLAVIAMLSEKRHFRVAGGSTSSPHQSARTLTLWSITLPLLNFTTLLVVALFNLPILFSATVLCLTTLLSFHLTRGDEAYYQNLAREGDEAEMLLKVVQRLRTLTPESERVKSLVATLLHAEKGLRSLTTVNSLIGLRHSSLYPLLQITLLWNLTTFAFALRWRERWESSFKRWRDGIAQLEALNALASLSYDNPSWCMPEIETTAPSVKATEMGHPLLKDESCVRNTIEVGATAPLIILTGSNMSGKSTLLRALGVNTALAFAGGPVCATAFTLTPLNLATSMRVSDSLAQGHSLFMAELLQIKEVIQYAQAVQEKGGAALFLLDEILHGTNSYERGVAVRRIVAKLLSHGAIGCVTTHDLTLAEPEQDWSPTPYYFSDTIDEGEKGPEMHFDYKLKEGVAPKTNALALLEAIGLG